MPDAISIKRCPEPAVIFRSPLVVIAPEEMVPTDVKFLLLKVISVPPELIDRLLPPSLVMPPRALSNPVKYAP